VGIVQGERAEIVEPAQLSGYVVTLGHHLLEDGTPIILPAGALGAAPSDPKKAAGASR